MLEQEYLQEEPGMRNHEMLAPLNIQRPSGSSMQPRQRRLWLDAAGRTVRAKVKMSQRTGGPAFGSTEAACVRARAQGTGMCNPWEMDFYDSRGC